MKMEVVSDSRYNGSNDAIVHLQFITSQIERFARGCGVPDQEVIDTLHMMAVAFREPDSDAYQMMRREIAACLPDNNPETDLPADPKIMMMFHIANGCRLALRYGDNRAAIVAVLTDEANAIHGDVVEPTWPLGLRDVDIKRTPILPDEF